MKYRAALLDLMQPDHPQPRHLQQGQERGDDLEPPPSLV